MNISLGGNGVYPIQQQSSESDQGLQINGRIDVNIQADIRINIGGCYAGGSGNASDNFDCEGNPVGYDDSHLYGGSCNGGPSGTQVPSSEEEEYGNSSSTEFEDAMNDELAQQQEYSQQIQTALQLSEKMIAHTIIMNAEASAQKMKTDTSNSIANGYVDSSNKATNANTQSSKGINF
ncbi:hypothetical protein [Vibrio mangrovi]|uniref:Uncharacterized protein n=1 Tax=Vibrio mangrovi TaxID=474394 RepID=A0A1Y6IXW4_9VIBR|nr:hypothetical protein [Vibrio mangrovi]MDW6001955.1 hypothetical protein [Vibrio mangrovi]SMS02497.1 hypothetical protein VIM7927_03830 [Vibrio mangrovi]